MIRFTEATAATWTRQKAATGLSRTVLGDITVNRDLALLRRMLVSTVEEKKLQFHLPKFPMVSEKDNVRQGFAEPARFRELLDAMPENLRTYLLFFYETGCRPVAAKQIIWDWVSLDEGLIRIPSGVTKNDAALPLPLSDELVRMLKKQFRRDGDPYSSPSIFAKLFRRHALL